MIAPRRVLPAVLVASILGACGIGTIGEPDGRDPGSGGPGPGEPSPAEAFAPSTASLKRLTRLEYGRTIHHLFGIGITVPSDLEVDTKLHGFASVAASELTISPRAAEQFEAAARDVARQVFADTPRRDALVGCAPKDATDPCIRTFLASFGRRVFRRPLRVEELDRYAKLVVDVSSKLGSTWVGVEHAVTGLLQSPNFLFRVEVGQPDPADPTRRRYDDWELATRLSFFLWGQTPDDALLDAAERGELSTVEGLRTQAKRLVASPKARSALRAYFSEYLNLERLDLITKDPAIFPEMTPALGTAMREEIERVFADVAFDRDADFREIFTTSQTFVDGALAELYGVPKPSGPAFSKVTLPESGPRAGLLGMAGVLTLYAHAAITSPTLRGKFVRTQLLCQDIPPPPGVITSIEAVGGDATVREKLTVHRTDATCNACHRLMDPIGLGLEDFDPLGKHRTLEKGKPVDASGELDGQSFVGGKALGKVLAAHPEIGSCQVRNLYRFATGHLETRGEMPLLDALSKRFAASGYRFKELLVEVVTSDGFRYAASTEGAK